MDHLPEKKSSEPEIIEPEIVGYEPKPSFWQRFKTRVLLSLIFTVIGLILCACGALLIQLLKEAQHVFYIW